MVSRNSLGKKILTYLVIVIALAAFIFPIYWMFIASFKENSILMRVPPQLYPTFKTIDNYISIITKEASSSSRPTTASSSGRICPSTAH